MNHPDRLQTRIDAYLMQLRRSLGELPPEEVADILREIRGHILERAEAAGEMTDDRLAAILKALGRPEDIAPLYQAEALMARARTSYSPTLLLRGALRWAMLSVKGFAIFLAGLIGYGIAIGFLGGAGRKGDRPEPGRRVGLAGNLQHRHDDERSPPTTSSAGGSSPIGLAVGAIGFVVTTRVLRWALGFAKLRKALPALTI